MRYPSDFHLVFFFFFFFFKMWFVLFINYYLEFDSSFIWKLKNFALPFALIQLKSGLAANRHLQLDLTSFEFVRFVIRTLASNENRIHWFPIASNHSIRSDDVNVVFLCASFREHQKYGLLFLRLFGCFFLLFIFFVVVCFFFNAHLNCFLLRFIVSTAYSYDSDCSRLGTFWPCIGAFFC